MTGRSTTCAGTRRLVPADARLLFFCARWDEQVKQRPSRPAQVRLRQSGERDRWTDGQRVERPAPRGGKEARGLRTLGHDFFYPSWERKADKGSRVDIRQQGTRSGVRRARRAGICRMAQSLPCLSQLAQLADGEVEWNWRDGGRGHQILPGPGPAQSERGYAAHRAWASGRAFHLGICCEAVCLSPVRSGHGGPALSVPLYCTLEDMPAGRCYACSGAVVYIHTRCLVGGGSTEGGGWQ